MGLTYPSNKICPQCKTGGYVWYLDNSEYVAKCTNCGHYFRKEDFPMCVLDGTPKPITNADSFRVEEAYNWRDDLMEITRRIVHETDEARLNNIAEHFEVDLSEIREFLKMKQRQKRKPKTKADRIRAMSDEELADELLEWFACFTAVEWSRDMILDWLKQEVKDD